VSDALGGIGVAFLPAALLYLALGLTNQPPSRQSPIDNGASGTHPGPRI